MDNSPLKGFAANIKFLVLFTQSPCVFKVNLRIFTSCLFLIYLKTFTKNS